MLRAVLGLLTIPLVFASTASAQAKLPPDALKVAADNNDFALQLYAELAKKDGNLFFSPYSISTALAMTYAGARGNTAEQMKTTLHFLQDPKLLHPGFRAINEHLLGKNPKRKFELSVANRLFGQKDYGFLPEFLKTGTEFYGAGLEELDFIKQREKARQTINAWVEKKTNDKIKELIKEGILSVDTRLVLTNAIYFKAAWARNFDEKKTAPGEFFVEPGKSVKVPMMRGSIRTGYFKGDGVEVLALPYEQNQLSMLVLLPAKDSSVAKLGAALTQANLKKWTGKFGDNMVDVRMPKFKYTSEFSLNNTLQALGMTDAFHPMRADFSGIASGERLFISNVVHKAFIDVHEKGTEAAAATAVVVDRTSLPTPATFTADRPFLFLIRDNASGSILFMGRVSNPA
jgi:serpin B